MDRITENLVEDYISNIDQPIKRMDQKFELFSNYCVMSKEYGETFDIEQVWLADDSAGIDGVAILVNGRLIEFEEEIDELIELNNYLDVTFIFVQSKTSPNFDSGEIGKFLFAVSDFFDDKPKLPRTNKINEKVALMNHLYGKSALMKQNPTCKLFYITTGVWTDDPTIVGRFESGKQELMQKSLFSSVSITPLGARGIQKYYQDTKSTISKEIIFNNRTIIPEISGVEQAYVGILEFREFKKLIVDDDDKMIGSVFFDNVRAFHGIDSPVNQRIRETLQTKNFDKFGILNNGITIVARSLQVVSNKFTLKDYSIVNGCQTSHILFEARSLDGIDKTNIPIRIIVTDDEGIRNKVIRSTNDQTEVKPEELEALSDYQKELEQYYLTTKGDTQLFYERRSKQFMTHPSVTKARIITIPIQIKSFTAMFLEEPHTVSRFYGKVIKYLGTRIFVRNHKPIVYYTSALAYFRLDQLFRNHYIDPKYKKCRYHLLMVMPKLIKNIQRPEFNANKIEEYCNRIIDELQTTEKSNELFQAVVKYVDSSGVNLNDTDSFKLQSTNELLLGRFRETVS